MKKILLISFLVIMACSTAFAGGIGQDAGNNGVGGVVLGFTLSFGGDDPGDDIRLDSVKVAGQAFAVDQPVSSILPGWKDDGTTSNGWPKKTRYAVW